MNTFSKKIVTIILAILISMYLNNVSLATQTNIAEIRIDSSKESLNRGETFDVVVSFKRNESQEIIEGIDFKLLYNPEILELISAENKFKATITTLTTCIDKVKQNEQPIKPGEVNFVGASTENITEDKELFKLSFKVKDNATGGKTTITINGEYILEDMDGNTPQVSLTNSNLMINTPEKSNETNNSETIDTAIEENINSQNITNIENDNRNKKSESSTIKDETTEMPNKFEENKNQKTKSITSILLIVLLAIFIVGISTIKIVDKKAEQIKKKKKRDN